MKIKSLFVKNLHGTITQRVNFNEDLSIIIGINGCGKTSILNVLEWMLKPNFARLAITEYDFIELNLIHNEINYTVTSRKTKDKVLVEVISKNFVGAPVEICITHKPSDTATEAEGHYDGLGPEDHEVATWNLLSSFQKPKSITLDRAITTDIDDEQLYESSRRTFLKKKSFRSPIDIVSQVTTEKYSEYRADATNNDSDLKAELLLSIFQEDILSIEYDRKTKPVTGEEITRLETKVTEYLSETIKSSKMKDIVHGFFSESRKFSQRISHSKPGNSIPRSLLYEILLSRHKKIENIARAFSQFEQKNKEAFLPLKKYLTTVNSFINDSMKEVYFEERNGNLYFRMMGRDLTNNPGRSISELSSGERQILILFTLIAFKSSDNGVFIVDEPELSLHPKWQYDFMDGFFNLRPEGTQVIIATHSPDIVGNYRDKCVALRSAEQ